VRIVYLSPCGQLGGAETSLLELLSSVRVAAPDWELWLVLGADGPLAAEAKRRGVQVVVQPFPSALSRLGDARSTGIALAAGLVGAAAGIGRYKRALESTVAMLAPDIIHTNGFKMHLLGAWIRPPRVPLIWHIHDYVSSRRLMSRLLRLFRKSCSVSIVNSRSVAADVHKLLPDLSIVPIYNAVDLRRFSSNGTKLDLDAAAGLSPARPGVIRVGLVATFAKWKGHNVFLQALARLSSDLPVRGYVIGGPIYETVGSQWSVEELKLTSDRLGLQDKVGFTGFMADVPSAIRSLDIVVHASTQPEPFGMVIIESMACGRPVIASGGGGALEIVADGENALAHPPGDVAVLARRIEQLALDAELRHRLGRMGRATAERLYGGERLAEQLLTLYRDFYKLSSTPVPIGSTCASRSFPSCQRPQ